LTKRITLYILDDREINGYFHPFLTARPREIYKKDGLSFVDVYDPINHQKISLPAETELHTLMRKGPDGEYEASNPYHHHVFVDLYRGKGDEQQFLTEEELKKPTWGSEKYRELNA